MMMRKKNILVLGFILSLSIILYAVFSNSDEWKINEQQRIEVYDNDYPHLNARERIMRDIGKVDYVAIVYPKANHVYPNSWFYRKILGSPAEGTTVTKANVEYTIIGDEFTSIIYGSAVNTLPNHLIVVALCVSDNNEFYAPDNGYEIPATNEVIKFLTSIDRKKIVKESSFVCPN